MDLRIVNTCNNNCTYCLEQSLRNKEKFVNKYIIFDLLKKEEKKEILSFFGGNPLLHPDLFEIIEFAKKNGFKNIGLLTNSFGLEKYSLEEFKKNNLTSFGIYFNNFDKNKHNLIVGKNGIKLNILLENIDILRKNNFFIKIIIHINKQNIKTIYKDILILNKKHNITNFEIINFFPFDRPYNEFKSILEYSISENKKYIIKIFKIIKKLQINVNFVKFSKDFFGEYLDFYNFQKGIIEQIGKEDIEKIGLNKEPFCKKENRCHSCFLKDKCIWYE